MSIFKYSARIENSNTNELITIGSYNTFETAINMLNKIYNSYINICNKDINIRPIKLLVFDNNKGYVVYGEHVYHEGYRRIVTPFMG